MTADARNAKTATRRPMGDLGRLIAPRTLALIGASAWTDAVAQGNQAVGFRGTIWRVHPTKASTATTTYYRSVDDLPDAPDAAFIAAPNAEVPAIAGTLAARGAGGFVCFSAGFSETGSTRGHELTRDLVARSGSVPFFGPNCYGFVNFFDRAAMMPDQIVGSPIDRGVAVICQSGTIALTLMFNHRSLPLGCLFTVGNQTRLAVEDLIDRLSDDPRVTAFGLYLEGVKDAAAFARAADKARRAGKPIAVVKTGRTAAAARTAHSHTGALAGEDSVFDAFCRQAGIARCDTLGTLCETLKIFHTGGALPGRRVLVMGASGGDMAMTADVSRSLDLEFSAIPEPQATALREQLTDRVTVANPLDIHTYLWFDAPAMGRVFSTALHSGYDAVGFMLDSPPEGQADPAAYDAVIDVFIAAAQGAPSRAALIASLPETISARIRERCLAGGVIPLQGQREALEALSLAGAVGATWGIGRGATARVELQLAARNPADDPASNLGANLAVHTLTEVAGKSALAAFGVRIPRGLVVRPPEVSDAAAKIGFPVVVKAVAAHLEHKSEVGGVILNVRSTADAAAAGTRLASLSETLLVEEMTTDGVAEVLIGVIVDAQFGQVLVIGTGGVLTELLSDSVSLLPPWTRESIAAGLARLKFAALLRGYRGKPMGDVDALLDAVLGVARYATAMRETLVEIDVNPVIVRPLGQGVVAVDAMIRLKSSPA
jgi:acyl-CoA synthetase (NDP forming)